MIDVEVDRVPTGALLNGPVAPQKPTVARWARIWCDGALVAVYAPFPGDLRAFRQACRTLPMPTTAVRGAGMRSKSQTFGFMARQPVFQRSRCSSCGVATAPAHRVIVDAAEALADQLADLAPEEHARLAECMAEVHPDWRLPGGLWTSGILNRTAALPYHYDRNNFDAWSAMPVVRSRVVGGHLALPEIGVTLDCADGSVVYFNGSRWLHGVTPIVDRMRSGYRYSAVYYPVRNMRRCLPFDEEYARATRDRVALEAGLIERQRRTGLIR